MFKIPENAGELQKEVEELKKEIETLKIKRQTEDEFRAEIWQAIEELKEKQDIIENGTKISVLCRKCKAENLVHDFAQWDYTCIKCGFDHASEYNDDEPKEPDYRALYEKEKKRWGALWYFLSSKLPDTKSVLEEAIYSGVLDKMQELEER